MKKVISFSLWGDTPKYTTGAIENIKLQKKIFPEWKCRFYIHDSVPNFIYNRLKNEGAELIDIELDLDEKYDRERENPGWFWRFKVLTDDSVDIAIIRDTDCRLSPLESLIVKEWENSNKEFHIIRNNKMHGVPVLAGLWGFRKSFREKIPSDLSKLYHSFAKNPKHQKYGGYDQQFLGEMIYPLLDMNNTMIHDSHHHYEHERVRPIFNLPNDDHFIGKDYEI